jgi:SSS family solute:Na+ symporter
MQNSTFSTLDTIVFFIYFLIVAGYGLYVYKRKQKSSGSASHDYFLAEGSLTWWAIGASLIASNISAEQFIGMSGSGFKMGMAIATYELMAAATLIIVAVFFMPVYLKKRPRPPCCRQLSCSRGCSKNFGSFASRFRSAASPPSTCLPSALQSHLA